MSAEQQRSARGQPIDRDTAGQPAANPDIASVQAAYEAAYVMCGVLRLPAGNHCTPEQLASDTRQALS